MNDKYYNDEPIYKIRPSNVKAKLKPMLKKESGYFSPYLLNAKLVSASKDGYHFQRAKQFDKVLLFVAL